MLKYLILYGGLLGLFWLLANVVLAQELELDYPGLPGPGLPSVPDFIGWIFKFALGAAGAVAFGIIVFGGIKYISSAGNPGAQGDAKQWIQGAILGLLLLLGSVLILTTINPDLAELGVPSSPNFTFGTNSAGQPVTIVVEPSAYENCLATPSNIDTWATCRCNQVKEAPLTSGISCPTYLFTEVFAGISLQHLLNYCNSPGDICAERTARGIREIYCCDINAIP